MKVLLSANKWHFDFCAKHFRKAPNWHGDDILANAECLCSNWEYLYYQQPNGLCLLQ